MKFDVAISLGSACQSRYHISRRLWIQKYGKKRVSEFALHEHYKSRHDWGSFYFDWSVSSLAGVNSTLRSKFANVMVWENMKLEDLKQINPNACEGSKVLIDSSNGFSYPHALQGQQDGTLTYKSFELQFDDFKSKMKYLAGKTLDMMTPSKSILFVRCCYGNAKEFEELIDIVENDYNLVNYKILFCPFIPDPNSGDEHHAYFEKNVTAIEHLAPMIVRPIRRKEYPGHIEEWEKVLSDFEFTLPDSDE